MNPTRTNDRSSRTRRRTGGLAFNSAAVRQSAFDAAA
jgi:hypothetical protein